jgi:hypothetical protein
MIFSNLSRLDLNSENSTAPCGYVFLHRAVLPSPDYACFASFARVVTSQRKARATAPAVTSTPMNAKISATAESLSIIQLYMVSPVDDVERKPRCAWGAAFSGLNRAGFGELRWRTKG